MSGNSKPEQIDPRGGQVDEIDGAHNEIIEEIQNTLEIADQNQNFEERVKKIIHDEMREFREFCDFDADKSGEGRQNIRKPPNAVDNLVNLQDKKIETQQLKIEELKQLLEHQKQEARERAEEYNSIRKRNIEMMEAAVKMLNVSHADSLKLFHDAIEFNKQ